MRWWGFRWTGLFDKPYGFTACVGTQVLLFTSRSPKTISIGKLQRHLQRPDRRESEHISCSVAHESDFVLSEEESNATPNGLKRSQLRDPVEFSSSASAKHDYFALRSTVETETNLW
eukprot:7002716-Pyramimonas_sp.AAC.1